MADNKAKWVWPVAVGAVAVFGIVFFVRKKRRDNERYAEAQEQIALVESNFDETTQNMGNNQNMAELAQKFYTNLGVTRYGGTYIVGNFVPTALERQELYNCALLCTSLQSLMQYFNQLTDNQLTFLDAINRSDLSNEGKTNVLSLLRVQKIVDKATGKVLGAFKGYAQNGMAEGAWFETNAIFPDDWKSNTQLFNSNNVEIINPVKNA